MAQPHQGQEHGPCMKHHVTKHKTKTKNRPERRRQQTLREHREKQKETESGISSFDCGKYLYTKSLTLVDDFVFHMDPTHPTDPYIVAHFPVEGFHQRNELVQDELLRVGPYSCFPIVVDVPPSLFGHRGFVVVGVAGKQRHVHHPPTYKGTAGRVRGKGGTLRTLRTLAPTRLQEIPRHEMFQLGHVRQSVFPTGQRTVELGHGLLDVVHAGRVSLAVRYRHEQFIGLCAYADGKVMSPM